MAFLGNLLRQGTEFGLGAIQGQRQREQEAEEKAKQAERDALEMAMMQFSLDDRRRGASREARMDSDAVIKRNQDERDAIAEQRAFADALASAGHIGRDDVERFAAMPVDQQREIVNAGLERSRINTAQQRGAGDNAEVGDTRLRDAVAAAVTRSLSVDFSGGMGSIDVAGIAQALGVSPDAVLQEIGTQAMKYQEDERALILGAIRTATAPDVEQPVVPVAPPTPALPVRGSLRDVLQGVEQMGR